MIDFDDYQQQLDEQSEGLVREITVLEAKLARAKESYLKVQGAIDLLNHQKQAVKETTSPTPENNNGIELGIEENVK